MRGDIVSAFISSLYFFISDFKKRIQIMKVHTILITWNEYVNWKIQKCMIVMYDSCESYCQTHPNGLPWVWTLFSYGITTITTITTTTSPKSNISRVTRQLIFSMQTIFNKTLRFMQNGMRQPQIGMRQPQNWMRQPQNGTRQPQNRMRQPQRGIKQPRFTQPKNGMERGSFKMELGSPKSEWDSLKMEGSSLKT